MTDFTKFDNYLNDNGPAALVIREPLMPVEGHDGVIFPATYAASQDGSFKGGYNIDGDENGENICLIDSVGSQANRIEPIFSKEPYNGLIPQIVVKAGEKEINILEAGHRAGDALVRCSSLQKVLQDAFKHVLKGDAKPMADVAPTSLIFGVWDSRDTQAKLPRLISSTIRAYNVRKLKRSAQFNPATEYLNENLLEEPADKATKDAYAERGFIHVPATGTHGGIVAKGGIRRDAVLGLAALRLLQTKTPADTLKLRRYILGLALVALTSHNSNYLRQGCMLVLNPDVTGEFSEVHPDGKRVPCNITHEIALEFATLAANDFGVGESKVVNFEKERAKRDVAGEGDNKKTAKGKAKKEKGSAKVEDEEN